jgi:hypothetical protein
MSNNYYLGKNPDQVLGDTPAFFYALRRGNDGSLYFNRSNQLTDSDSIEINDIGAPEDNYTDFEVGIDFYEGRDVFHNKVFTNLKYEQYRWDNRSIFYYIDDNGQLVARINDGFNYDDGSSPE